MARWRTAPGAAPAPGDGAGHRHRLPGQRAGADPGAARPRRADPGRSAKPLVVIETEGDRRSPDTAWGEGASSVRSRGRSSTGAAMSRSTAPRTCRRRGPQLRVAAYLPRADPAMRSSSGATCSTAGSRTCHPGTRVGRQPTADRLPARPSADLLVHPLHGNVDTRLARLDAGDTDALVLAVRRAGSPRLFRPRRRAPDTGHRAAAPGQGVSPSSPRRRPRAPRPRRGGRRSPVRQAVRRNGRSSSPPGAAVEPRSGPWPRSSRGHWTCSSAGPSRTGATGRPAADRGSDDGRRSVERWPSSCTVLAGSRPRDPGSRQAGDLLLALHAAGLQPVPVPAIEVELGPGGGALDDTVRDDGRCAWGRTHQRKRPHTHSSVLPSGVRPFSDPPCRRGVSDAGRAGASGGGLAFVPSQADGATLAARCRSPG